MLVGYNEWFCFVYATDEFYIFFSDASRCITVLSLPSQLKENPQLLLQKESDVEEEQTAPIITYGGGESVVCDDSIFSIVAENVVIATTNSLIDAVGLLLATYFVFNLVYPGNIESSLTFIQKVLVGHTDKVKTIPKINTLLNRIFTA